MNILSKKDFCNIIEKLKHNEEYIDKLNDVFRAYKSETQVFSTGLESSMVEILEIIFNDTEENWISYWCWELGFGKHYSEGTVTEFNGDVISLKTAEDLYDFLIANQTKKLRG